MGKEQRVRRLRNVGGSASSASSLTDASATAEGVDSRSQDDAPNSESSALGSAGSASSPTGGSRPEARLEGHRRGARSPAGGSARSPAEGSRPEAPPSPTEELRGYDWYGEYVELTQGYAWRVAAYIAWAASPAVGRRPATQLELAQVLGLKTDRTIRQWKEKEPGIEAEIKRVQAGPLLRHRRDLYEALVKAALLEGSGGHADRKLALEMMGDYTPKLKQTLDANVKTVPFTADELAQAEAELKAFEDG